MLTSLPQSIHALIKEIIQEIAIAYNGNYAEARAVTLTLLAHHLQCKSHELFLQPDISKLSLKALRKDIDLLKQSVPYQYVVGYVDFLDFRIQVQPGVFIPRPETEQLVTLIHQQKEKFHTVLDIGTGTGCIAIAMKRYFPETKVFALDFNPVAIHIAQRNAHNLHVHINLIKADVLTWDPISHVSQDDTLLVVSNPPYVLPAEKTFMPKQVLNHEPHEAIFVPDEDPILFYKAMLEKFKLYKAILYFEINPLTLQALEDYAKKLQFTFCYYKDFNDKERFFKAMTPRYLAERM